MKLTIAILLLSLKGFSYDLTHDTTLSGTWNLHGTVLNVINGKISGGGTIDSAIIQGNSYVQIFDTSISFTHCKSREWSVMWMGANSSLADNYYPIQRSLNICVQNDINFCFIPQGNYRYSLPLKVQNIVRNVYQGTHLNVYGEGSFWGDVSILTYTATTGFAFSFQYAKGGSFHNLKLQGQWTPPVATSPGYYSITQGNFTDRNGLCGRDYRGLIIDWDGSRNRGGSTGLHVYDCNISGFTVLYCISPNGVTQNADILIFENIQCGNGQIGFQSNQPQEKGNVIRGIYSWGAIHTLISIGNNGGAGNYLIEGGNIAGACIRLFDIRQSGWFPSHISFLYAENFGVVGSISTGDSKNKNPIVVDACVFHPAFQNKAGKLMILTTNSPDIKISNCQFAYYGAYSDTLIFIGNATFENCRFANPTKGLASSQIINYPLTPLTGSSSNKN